MDVDDKVNHSLDKNVDDILSKSLYGQKRR